MIIGNKPEDTRERRKTKKISRQNKTIQIKNDISKQGKKIPTSKLGVNVLTHTYNRIIRKQNNFGAKYGNERNITEKPN